MTDKEEWTVRSTRQDSGFLPTLGVTLWLGWNGGIICLALYSAFFAGFRERTAILGLVLVSYLTPRDLSIGFRLGNWCMSQAEKYFGLTTILENEDALLKVPREKAIIYAFEPHDILPYPVFAFNSSLKRFPSHNGKDFSALMTSVIFQLPFLRQMYTWVGGNPIDKATFKRRLARGESFAFVPGGVQEVTNLDPASPTDIPLYLKSRKGFIRLALATGAPIVPVFGFNIDGSYGYWIPRGGLVMKLARKIGFLPLVFWGRFGVPFGIPRPRNIAVVCGKPIDVPCEGDNVKEETVAKIHADFLQAMEALFERHKNENGYGSRKIRII